MLLRHGIDNIPAYARKSSSSATYIQNNYYGYGSNKNFYQDNLWAPAPRRHPAKPHKHLPHHCPCNDGSSKFSNTLLGIGIASLGIGTLLNAFSSNRSSST